MITNLAVLDFESRRPRRCACVSVHPGVDASTTSSRHTGFELRDRRRRADQPRPADAEELEALDRLDPAGLRHREVPDAAVAMHVPRLHTRSAISSAIEVPIVQTGMGWVAGARLVSATANAGALGILASATMDFDELRAAIAEVKQRTDQARSVSTCAPTPPTSTTASRC